MELLLRRHPGTDGTHRQVLLPNRREKYCRPQNDRPWPLQVQSGAGERGLEPDGELQHGPGEEETFGSVSGMRLSISRSATTSPSTVGTSTANKCSAARTSNPAMGAP